MNEKDVMNCMYLLLQSLSEDSNVTELVWLQAIANTTQQASKLGIENSLDIIGGLAELTMGKSNG